MCPNSLIHGSDVDTARFMESLRAIADGLEDGSVAIDEVTATKHATADDLADFDLSFRYVAEAGDGRVTDPIRYVSEGPAIQHLDRSEGCTCGSDEACHICGGE